MIINKIRGRLGDYQHNMRSLILLVPMSPHARPLVCWLYGWPVGWMLDWSVGWSVGWLVGWLLVGRLGDGKLFGWLD